MLKNTFTSTSFTFNELIRKILLAILFLTPLISERLFLSSLNLIQILILCASLLWLLSRKFFAQKFSIPDKALIVFVSMSIISIFVSSYLNTTFYEVKKILYYFLIYVIVSDLFNDFNSVKRINFIIIFTGIFVALYGLYQYFYGFADTLKSIDWKSISDVGEIQKNLIAKRIFSTFLYPNSLAGYFIMIIPIAISSVLTEKHSYLKVFYIILTAIFVFALYLTHSVAGWFAFFCTIIFFILLNNLYGKTGKIKPLFLLIISIIFLVGGIFILKERIDVFKDIHSPANSVIARLHYWKSALVLMMDSPFLGKGLGTYGAEFLNLKSEKIFYAQYAHNFYLQLGAEVGILGMFSFIVFAVYAIFKAIKRLNTVSLPQHYIALISACFGFLVHNFFDFDAYLWELSFIWWVMMAIIYPISGLKSLSNSFNLKLKKDWLLNFLLYFLLFFAPFLQGGKTPLALTIINLSILLLAYLVLKTKEEIKISSISLPLLVFLVWVSFSAFYSVHKYASLAQIVQIYIYVLFYYVIINSSFVVADLSAKKIADKSATTVNLFYVIIGSSVIVSIWGISEFLFFNKVRISACFPNPNLLAGYIVSAIGLAINFLLYNDKTKKSEKLIAIVLLIVSLPALFLTKSRGGFLALFIVLLITLAGMLLVKQKRKILLIILICFVVFSAIVIPQLLNRMNTDPFAYGRISIWKSTIEMIKDKMLIGWGIGTYEDVFPKYNFPVDGCIARYGRFENFAHSEPLQFAAETIITGGQWVTVS
ncbi:MAG: O-antigen ligase family protein, partial [Candidatus Firestonebacteria bacterium]